MFVRRPVANLCVKAAVLAAAAVCATPVLAQQRLSLSERVERLERQAAGSGGAQGGIEQVNRLQDLQSQVQVLQGQIEELRHQLSEAQGRARDQYIDLDSRLGRIEGRGAAAIPSVGATPDPALQDIELGAPASAAPGTLTADDARLAPPGDTSGTLEAPTADTAPADAMLPSDPADPQAEMRAYDEAFAALKDGRYAESARRFQSFIDQYPNADLTGNAYYWLGESYYVTQNYRVALETFSALLSRFPENAKAPDALLKTGYCQYELKQWDAAEATLNSVIETYPDTTVARLAQGRLRALQLENRR
jgi:tol-pal system protein YbgF